MCSIFCFRFACSLPQFFHIDTFIYCRNRSRIFLFQQCSLFCFIFSMVPSYIKKKFSPYIHNPYSKSRKIPLSRKNIKHQFISLCSGMKFGSFYLLFLKHFFVTSKVEKSPVLWNTYYRWYDHFCKLFY